MKTKVQTKKKIEHPCRYCGKESVSYYRQPMWTYPDSYKEDLELWYYCDSHREEVLNLIPKKLREAVRLVFTKSGRETVIPELSNRIVVYNHTVKVVGVLGNKLAYKAGWPSLKDTNYDEMVSKKPGTLFLVYNVGGKFKGSFRKMVDAERVKDVETDVMVFKGEENEL